MSTPSLSFHARERCREMGISTKVAKRIVQQADLTRPDGKGHLISTSQQHPDYLVVHSDPALGPVVVVTVAFRCEGKYVRNGTTYIPATHY